MDDLLSVEWSSGAEGEQLYYVSREGGRALVYSVDPVSTRRSAHGELPSVAYMDDFEPMADGRIAWLVQPGNLKIRELDGRVREIETPGWLPFAVHAAPKGTQLLVSGWKYPALDSIGLLALDPDAGTSRLIWSDMAENIQFAWLDDGSIRMAVIWNSARSELFALSADGRPPRSLGSLPFPNASYRFAPDGKSGVAVERLSRDDLWLVRDFDKVMAQ